MKCSNIWDLGGDCSGKVSDYRVWDSEGKKFYDENTKAPFEKSGFSIKGAIEVRGPRQIQAIVTSLCDHHLRELMMAHPNLEVAMSSIGAHFPEEVR